MQKNRELRQRGEQSIGSGIISKGFADVDKTIRVSGAEDKASPELKWIFPQFVLMMARRPRAFSARGVILAQKMQQVCRPEPGNSVSPALFVDQQRKRDAGLLAEHARVMAISQSDGGKRSTFLAEGLLPFAQLRDMLAAEDSSVVPQEYDYGGTAGPQRTKSNLLAVGIRKHDLCESGAERWLHGSSILKRAYSAVKPRAHIAEYPSSALREQEITRLLIDIPAERA